MIHVPMSKTVLLLTVLLGAAATLASCKVKAPEAYEGTWVITEAALPGVAGMSEAQANTWLGKSFSYGSDRAQLAQAPCLAPEYQRDTLNNDTFQAEYHTHPDKLDFEIGEITRVRLQCNEEPRKPGQTLLMQENIATYLIWNGVFFKLEKSRNEATPAVASL